MTVTVLGIEEMKRKCALVRPLVDEAAAKAMEQGADEIVQMMVRFVARGTEPLGERTMRVWQSIGWTWGTPPPGAMVLGRSSSAGGKGRRRIVIYAGGEGTMVGKRKQFNLARLLEFGTKDSEGEVAMAAIPYFFPAWRVGKKKTRARISRNMRTALKKGLA